MKKYKTFKPKPKPEEPKDKAADKKTFDTLTKPPKMPGDR